MEAANAARIIPARAGFTGGESDCNAAMRDHPRSRGVYIIKDVNNTVDKGSSPLARGLRTALSRVIFHSGIIPARAGFTMTRGSSPAATKDHPRSRGVYAVSYPKGSVCRGSSPLARGLRRSIAPTMRRPGIIPARAGFTRSRHRTATIWPDHPRSRGVYTSVTTCPRRHGGSSPLARGLPQTIPKLTDRTGIIPARAGFTTPLSSGT